MRLVFSNYVGEIIPDSDQFNQTLNGNGDYFVPCPSPPSRNFILFAAVYNSFSLTLMPPLPERVWLFTVALSAPFFAERKN